MNLSGTKPPKDLLRKLVLEDLKEPVIFRGFISDWECLSWELRDWSEKLGDKLMPFRSGVRKITPTPQWESKCQMTHLTMKEFLELAEKNGNSNKSSSNWFYFDYKYMHEWFHDVPNISKSISWEAMGFPEVKGEQSTMWIGSDGAHTPCHYDTYGCNLVAQVYGIKQWILFPPQKSESLLPTRVPYEESSVYSKHNFYTPDPQISNDLQKAWIVTLNPGEVLFVPHHWWHYVENVGTAISINTWLPLPSDTESRLEEAVVKLFVAQLVKEAPGAEYLLNPNEEEIQRIPLGENTALLETCLQLEREHCNEEEFSMQPKRRKISPEKFEFTSESVNAALLQFKASVQPVPTCSGEELTRFFSTKRTSFKAEPQNEDKNISPITYTVEKVINALCHPDVISTVKEKLRQEFYGNSPC